MKKAAKYRGLTIYHSKPPVCPNAADEQYFADKAVDLLTGIVSVAGFASAMLFLATLS